MRTVSLELAKKLKEAGLQHQITYGDWHLAWLPETEIHANEPVLFDYTATGPFEEDIWLPTLSDLLEWLERQEYYPVLRRRFVRKYHTEYQCQLWRYEEKFRTCDDYTWSDYVFIAEFHATTIEDAAAKAVLWVLKQEGKGKWNAASP